MEELNKEKNIELIQFLNQEKLNKKINVKKIYTFYNKCLIKSIIELETKFANIENKNLCIENGINMIYYIFFILIFYTNNIRLTIFLLERSILFYTEFIIMSQDKKLIDQICFVPNINDALFFTYKKTIGPLEINNMKLKNDQIFIREICKSINLVYKVSILNDNNITNLNNIQREISLDLYLLFLKSKQKNSNKIFFLINEILNIDLVFRKKLFLVKLFVIICIDSPNKNYENIYKKIVSEVDNITNFQIQNIKY